MKNLPDQDFQVSDCDGWHCETLPFLGSLEFDPVYHRCDNPFASLHPDV